MRVSMREEEIREMAHKRNDKGRDKAFPCRDKFYTEEKGSSVFSDEHFRDKVASYIDSIPLDPTKLKSCPACEGVLCGLCGKCHDLERKDWHHDPECPAAHHMHQGDLCSAWVFAYHFLKDASKQVEVDA
jgi:hypothetical protein